MEYLSAHWVLYGLGGMCLTLAPVLTTYSQSLYTAGSMLIVASGIQGGTQFVKKA